MTYDSMAHSTITHEAFAVAKLCVSEHGRGVFTEVDRSSRRLACYFLTLILVGLIFPMSNNMVLDAIDMAHNLVAAAEERNVSFLTEIVATGRYDGHAKAFAEFYRLDDTYEELVRIRDMPDE